MTLLYPSFLWLLIPLVMLLKRGFFSLVNRVHLVILILIVLALSRPVLKQITKESEIEGKNIIIALDISYSMSATDIKPNRYEFAKETIYHLLESHSADNIMLIAFTTNPLLLSPPTTDHRVIKTALESLNREFILTKGTSLKKLFEKLTSMDIGHQDLILITDGGEESNPKELKEILAKRDISLIVLALGTKQGTTISRDKILLKDKNGDLVVSRLNPMLKSLTPFYIEAYSSSKVTANEIYSNLSNNRNRAKKMQQNYFELYQTPLILAILLFLILHTRANKLLKRVQF